AIQTEGLAQGAVVAVVPGEADQRLTVLADAVVAAGVARAEAAGTPRPVGASVAADGPGVHRAERGWGEGCEHGWVGGDGVGDAFAANQARADQVVGVASVSLGTGGADRVPAVPARFVDDLVGHVAGGDRAEQFPGRQINGAQDAVEADRGGASRSGPDVIEPGEVVISATGERRGGGPA